ncbi:MAG: hypothetical protein ACI9XK_003099 [Granulosicoccus sp.]|jgi:hypothetical protein
MSILAEKVRLGNNSLWVEFREGSGVACHRFRFLD